MLRHDNGSALASGSLLQFPIGRTAPAPLAELVLIPAIPFHSLCAHHLLPFDGVVHIGYVDGENELSQAEFARVVEACSRGIQVQQQMTTRMGLWLHHQLAPRGLGVLVEGGYSCETDRDSTPFRGPKTTLAFYGSLRRSANEQREFLTLTRQRTQKLAEGKVWT